MGNITLQQQLEKKILIIDGAMGTMIQNAQLSADDFGGEQYEGCNEYLTLTAPHVIKHIHEAYLQAGADIIETNTFGATSIVLDEYDLGHLALELNIEAAKLARKAADAYSTPEWPRFVAGSMGPTTKTLSVTGGVTFEQLAAAYEEQARGLLLGGVDLLLLETCQDTLNVKAGFIGIMKAFAAVRKKVPIMISGTIEPMGTTLAGQTIESFFISVQHMKPFAVGLNCATGPEFMTDHLRTLASLANTAVSCYPNAGLPDEEGCYHETPDMLAKKIQRFAEKGWINIVGGCCGTTPEHIRAIAEAVRGIPPRPIPASFDVHAVSGIDPLIYDETMRPLFVGERTNVIGSRKFKRLIAEGKYEEAAEIARAQVKNGAHVIDICLADPDRNEQEDMEKFIQQVIKKVKVPLVIDSTDERVIECALTYSQGKAIINSINLEDGEERFAKVVPLLHKYGAAVVVGTIDEQGMAIGAERKLEIALRSYDLLVNKYGVSPRDIIFDPLVFPVGTGDEQYIGAAKETIEGIRLIKERLPQCLTMLGISNVSFGLPPLGREILNSVFLYHCTQAGLDYAIVNTEKLERFASIPEEEVRLAEELLFNTNDETLNTFIQFYRNKMKEPKKAKTELSLEERLANYVVEGTKDGLFADLEQALQTYADPLDIINGPLMAGMDEVGRLFNDNQLIVAEVLQSAEVMKAAVAFLEPYMEKKESSTKGKVILATVKGDVHDIGKNLVDIILSNNGFQVIDLGIKVTPQKLIEAVQAEKPDIIGLSGLLVKSAQQMVVTAQDLRQAGISIPILVGGAALTRKFTENKIAPEYDGIVLYAKDAMEGLALANQLQQNEIEYTKTEKHETKPEKTAPTVIAAKSNVSTDVPVFVPADLERHVLKDISLPHIIPYVNWQMVLGHHLGLKGKVKRLLEEKDEKALMLKQVVDDLLQQAQQEQWITPAALYQFFPAQSEGNRIYIYSPEDKRTIIETFEFPRQPRAPYLCLADYLKPVESGQIDYVGFFAVTAGKGIRELAQRWKENGEFLKSHAIQALALEVAEGLAEFIHQVMRDRWGFPDDPDFTMEERFAAKYQGQRYSFGYPACPNLEDQEKLFRLLRPEEIGIQLTDGYMMEPEASVSAIVFAHPEARYFNVL
ncbi:methionine synthase [Parageobacillus thermoglucosidasius]|uniref:methionine synthase n=1 Tax=Parageobacillus thermoglucosidasius TaxID=1426 RepID=UPI001FCC1D56|nr:methionine synthase [Parageobacillus thermoglucosidasius]MED4903108.1 methionine synthase [Parageobacillus thermoglucosidasius]MED4915099.1 methionine synthase [Parageobacillus thermoglucosidasius]MED4946012.1 methionine synthase [Parageobacillus thermoglucosidasius]MED4981620.1 methionine synthase [Parageobacillus thermoglucosidasius]BDG33234.1 methionine synthase [Parageobacillus thermoglucosidasius]